MCLAIWVWMVVLAGMEDRSRVHIPAAGGLENRGPGTCLDHKAAPLFSLRSWEIMLQELSMPRHSAWLLVMGHAICHDGCTIVCLEPIPLHTCKNSHWLVC